MLTFLSGLLYNYCHINKPFFCNQFTSILRHEISVSCIRFPVLLMVTYHYLVTLFANDPKGTFLANNNSSNYYVFLFTAI